MKDFALPRYMRCVATTARRTPIHAGTYASVLMIDGHAPNRTAVVVDSWGASQFVHEHEGGRWQLTVPDQGPVAELVLT